MLHKAILIQSLSQDTVSSLVNRLDPQFAA